MADSQVKKSRLASDKLFYFCIWGLCGLYLMLILMLLIADASFTSVADVKSALQRDEIRYSIKLTFLSCLFTAILSVIFAVPTGYIFSRFRFPGKTLIDAMFDIPIILPPLVIGLSLLILFHKFHIAGDSLENWFQTVFTAVYTMIFRKEPDFSVGISYKIPAVILAQFTVSCAFASRTMRHTFDQISPRCEQVAMTLGCNRSQAFWRVALPEAWRGVMVAGALAWARALGEFGPILIFAGTTRGRTEVLSTSVFLEISTGNLEAAVAISMLMVGIAMAILFLVRWLDGRRGGIHDPY